MIESEHKSTWARRLWSRNRRPMIVLGAIALWLVFGVMWVVIWIAADIYGPDGAPPGKAGGNLAAVVFENKSRIAVCRSPDILACFRNTLDHYSGGDSDVPMTPNFDVTIYFCSGVVFSARGSLGEMANGRLIWRFTGASLMDGPRSYSSAGPVPPAVKAVLNFLRKGHASKGRKVFREF